MSDKEKKRETKGISFFTIGTKLVTIVSIIVLVSLGSITLLASWLIREDLRRTAEESNFETNRRSAMDAEQTITKTQADSLILIRMLSSVAAHSASRDTADFFFEQYPQIAALFFTSTGKTDELLINQRFFQQRQTDVSLADSFYERNNTALKRAVLGETLLLNAAPHFAFPLLALFFPWQNGGAAVLVSSENLNDVFGFGPNKSYLINDMGEILVHSDFDLVRNGANMAERSFTRFMWEHPLQNTQVLFTDEDGLRYFNAFTKLNSSGAAVITSIEYNKVFEGIDATIRRNIYLSGAVLLISIMLIWFFAKTISVPLKVLAAAAQSIEGGNFEVELKPKGRDEIGFLTESFRKMSSALAIFGRFTNRGIAVQAMRGEIRRGGIPKHATIFFSDIREFTALSENFSKVFGYQASDHLVLWLNNYLTQMIECVEKTSGVVDKFIGDAIMAHWGTAFTLGNPRMDALSCVKAALMMRKALFKMNRERKPGDPGDPPIRIGCGINTGIVTAGQIGSSQRMEYTVIGDPVNLASRLESLTKPFRTDILISENTWNFVKDQFITEEMPSVEVKGLNKSVRVFAVVNVAGVKSGPRTLAELRQLLGLEAPDLSKVNINADEKKYKIG